MDPVDSARRLTSIPAMNILTSERAGLSTVVGGMTRMTPPRNAECIATKIMIFLGAFSILALSPSTLPPPPPTTTLELLASQIAALQREVAALRQLNTQPCDGVRPLLTTPFAYSGCNRNVHRNSTVSVETCQNGTLTAYNQSVASGLFDISIQADIATHDQWHFVCSFNPEAAHVATCTLTFEFPLRPEGPAWLQLFFENVTGSSPHCTPGRVSILGTYFYDALTNDAGVYRFDAVPVA